jgi:hypothetical protein
VANETVRGLLRSPETGELIPAGGLSASSSALLQRPFKGQNQARGRLSGASQVVVGIRSWPNNGLLESNRDPTARCNDDAQWLDKKKKPYPVSHGEEEAEGR